MIAMPRKILIIQNRLNKQILHYLLPIKKNCSSAKGLKLKISIFKKQSIRFIIIIFRN